MKPRTKLTLGATAVAATALSVLIPFSGVGAATGKRPVGALGFVRVNANRTVTVAGWTFDPDAPSAAVSVEVVADGRSAARTSARLARPDVVRANRTAGPNTGFTISTGVLAYGSHSVCVIAYNRGAGSANTNLGCRTINLADPNLPIGTFTGAVNKKTRVVTLGGWAFDPNTRTTPIRVGTIVNGRTQAIISTRGVNAALNKRFTLSGAHAFSAAVVVPYGHSTVCVAAYNVRAGSSATRSLGCLTYYIAAPVVALGTKVATIARQQVGRPYVFGGTTPAGFDCSGLAYYAYKQIGKTLGRDANAQYRQFRAIPQSAAKPGDLIFFHAGSYIYHVGIYQGGNMMVAAADIGEGVKYQAIWSPAVTFGTILH